MGFEEMEEEPGLKPIEGVMDIPVPASLAAAAVSICSKVTLFIYFDVTHTILQSDISSSDNKAKDLEKKQAGSPVKYMNLALYGMLLLLVLFCFVSILS